MNLLYVIVGLMLLVFVHELGHFVVARLVGAKATRFLVGFPPVLLKARRGETEYGIGAIPLGGYVRIVGMTRPQASDAAVCQDALEEADLRRPAGQRDILGPAVALLRQRLEGAGDDARVEADRVLLALDAEQDLLHEKTYAETRRHVERLRDDLDRRAYWRLPVWRRIAIVAAGPAANVIAAIAILTVFFWQGVPVTTPTTTVATVSGAPAQEAGLLPGDEVVQVDGVAVNGDWERVTRAIQDSKGAEVALVVRRDGADVELAPARPEAVEGQWRLGFSFADRSDGTRSEPLPEAVGSALSWSWFVTSASVAGLADIVTTREGHQQVSSIVGITAAAEDSVDQGSFLWTMGVISLALAIFNLLPFLPLDGGHIMIAVIEKLRRGRPLSRVVIERISVVGIALVLVLFAIGLTNDIGRFGGP